MYIYYSTGNILGLRTLVCIVEVSVIGGVHFRRFHCIGNGMLLASLDMSEITSQIENSSSCDVCLYVHVVVMIWCILQLCVIRSFIQYY